MTKSDPTPSTSSVDPIELLRACHDKVRRFAKLLLRLRAHLETQAPDRQAQEAAQSILRYFNVAAPLHHDDEELNLFPALRLLGLQEVDRHIAHLEGQHAELSGMWEGIQIWLKAIEQGLALAPATEIDDFVQTYLAHAQSEEDDIYPFATQLTPRQIADISAAMVTRRTTT